MSTVDYGLRVKIDRVNSTPLSINSSGRVMDRGVHDPQQNLHLHLDGNRALVFSLSTQ